MPTSWDELQKDLFPIKDYEDLSRRWRESFEYPFVLDSYNFTMPEIIRYTDRLLGEDTRQRYTEYNRNLVKTFERFNQAGVKNLRDLTTRVDSRQSFEQFCEQSGIPASEIISALKYLVYWVIPVKKRLAELARPDEPIQDQIKVLQAIKVRFNLDLIEQGRSETGRQTLAGSSGLDPATIVELVNRADLSRMPWASKATISNIVGAGYGRLSKLANAAPQKLFDDFARYGETIGKNLNFGNEIESSYRIAKIIPLIIKN